jgi:hypothetical protein
MLITLLKVLIVFKWNQNSYQVPTYKITLGTYKLCVINISSTQRYKYCSVRDSDTRGTEGGIALP